MKKTATHITKAITTTLLALIFTTTLWGQGKIDDYNIPAYYSDIASDLFEREQWKAGKDVIDKGLRIYPDESTLHMLAGKYWFHQRNYDRSRYHLIKSLDGDYNNVDAKQLLITIEEITGNYSSAICYVNELLEVNPYWRGLWRRKIDLYYKQGNMTEANRLFKRLQHIYPNDQALKDDYFIALEESYFNYRNSNDSRRAFETLVEMVKINPHNEEYQMALVNYYIKIGNNEQAVLQASEALADNPGNIPMLRKKASLLSELGRHNEAIAMVNATMKSNYDSPEVQKLYRELLSEAARLEHQRDPYILYGMMYERSKSDREALRYLLNTSISRGYDQDALYYIAESKKHYGANNKNILTKEYELLNRLGREREATAVLERLYTAHPGDYDITYALCLRKMAYAEDMLFREQYKEALPDLTFAATAHTDTDIITTARLRLLACHTQLANYDKADSLLTLLQSDLDETEITDKRAQLLHKRGETEKSLAMYAAAISAQSDTAARNKLIVSYEDIAIPHIKLMTEQGLYKRAYSTTQTLLHLSPRNHLGLMYAANLSNLLGDDQSFAQYVQRGRELYPDDLNFIIKESILMDKEGRHDESTAMLYAKLDEYPGDKDLINAFSGSSIQFALALSKEKQHDEAITVLDTAIVYNMSNKELKYTKGIIYERDHKYDSAYHYQRYHEPSALEEADYLSHMKGLQHKTYKNTLDFEYIQSRYSEYDVISGVATVGYTHKRERILYMGRLNYSGRNGSLFSGEVLADSAALKAADGDSGGTGIQLIGGVSYTFNDKWTGSASIGWGHLYFPKLMASLSATRHFKNDWEAEAGLGYRRLPTSKDNLINATLGAAKTIEAFRLSGNIQGIILDSKPYYNINLRTRYLPLEDNRTFIEAMGGIGTAPELTLIDYYSLSGAFSHLNTFVGLGGQYLVNSHIALGVMGTWHTLYDQRVLIDNTVRTQFRNLYNIYVQAVLSF